MSNLYRDADWSQKDLDKQIREARKHMTKCKINSLSWDYLKYYKKQLCQRKREGRKTSFIDLWSLVLESLLHDGVQYVIKQHLQWLTIVWKLISGEGIFLFNLGEVVCYETVCMQMHSHFQNIWQQSFRYPTVVQISNLACESLDMFSWENSKTNTLKKYYILGHFFVHFLQIFYLEIAKLQTLS